VYVALYSHAGARRQDSYVQGISPCPDSDIGRLQIDPVDFLSKDCLSQVHLHPVDDSETDMAISPNNMAFLVNLTLPVVCFTVAMLFQKNNRVQQLAIFNIMLLNDDLIANSQLSVAMNSNELIRQTIATSNDYERSQPSSNAESNFIKLYIKTLSSALQNGLILSLVEKAKASGEGPAESSMQAILCPVEGDKTKEAV